MKVLPKRFACLVFLAALVGCGGSSKTTSGTDTTDSGNTSAANYTGVYSATYAGTYTFTSPPGLTGGSNTDTATITISDLSSDQIKFVFQVPPNPPSGVIDFTLAGDMGTVVGTGTGGNCFMGLVGTNEQTNCCTKCSIVFEGNTFTQPNAGTFTGTTAAGVAYTGTYNGVWTGTKQ